MGQLGEKCVYSNTFGNVCTKENSIISVTCLEAYYANITEAKDGAYGK